MLSHITELYIKLKRYLDRHLWNHIDLQRAFKFSPFFIVLLGAVDTIFARNEPRFIVFTVI